MDLLSGSYHSLFTIARLVVIMTLEFETTHEYYLRDASIYYCSEHEALIVTRDHEDRVLINGISNETMLEFASKQYKDSLVKQCIKDKDAVQDKDVLINLPEGTNLTKQAVADRPD